MQVAFIGRTEYPLVYTFSMMDSDETLIKWTSVLKVYDIPALHTTLSDVYGPLEIVVDLQGSVYSYDGSGTPTPIFDRTANLTGYGRPAAVLVNA